MQASLAALVAVPKLPPDTLAYLASGDRPVEGASIPGIDPSFDPLPFARVFTEMFFGVTGVNVAHEIGHRILAGVYGVKLGPSLNVPNGSLGSFGAVTPTASPYKNRKEVFDIGFAGPLCGTIVAALLFAYGLIVRCPTPLPPAFIPAFTTHAPTPPNHRRHAMHVRGDPTPLTRYLFHVFRIACATARLHSPMQRMHATADTCISHVHCAQPYAT